MKKYVISIILILSAAPIFAQSSVWKVSDGNTSLYLGGTVHVLREEDYPLPAEYDYAYSESDTVVFETDIGRLDDPDIVSKIINDGMYRDGRSLKTILEPAVYRELEEALGEYQISIETVKYFKPGMLSSTLGGLTYQKAGMALEGVDVFYYKKAVEDKKKVEFLESVELQLKALMNMGVNNENEFILYTLRDLEKSEVLLDALIEDWRTGGNEVMETSLTELKNEFAGTYDNLVADRNKLWIKKIRQYLLSSDTEFILFGTLHLHGKDGILTRLGENGLNVQQVMLSRQSSTGSLEKNPK